MRGQRRFERLAQAALGVGAPTLQKTGVVDDEGVVKQRNNNAKHTGTRPLTPETPTSSPAASSTREDAWTAGGWLAGA